MPNYNLCCNCGCFYAVKSKYPPPYFPPTEIDDNAVPLGDGKDEKMTSSAGGGAVSMTYSDKVEILLASNQANIDFQNPSKSTSNMVLQLYVVSGGQEVMIAESGLLPPGVKLEKMNLLGTAGLSLGNYNGKFKVLYYNPETGEKAIVNTEAPVKMTVA